MMNRIELRLLLYVDDTFLLAESEELDRIVCQVVEVCTRRRRNLNTLKKIFLGQ